MDRKQPSTAKVRTALTEIRRLSSRSARDTEGRYWLEGIRHFVQAVDAGRKLDLVIHCPILLKSDLAQMLVRRLGAQDVPRYRVSPEEFRSVCKDARASGIGGIAKQHWSDLSDADPSRGNCWLVIDEIRSPGNLGTILRTAEASGVGGVIFVSSRCDPFASDVLRASMGGVFHLTLVRTGHEQLRQWAKSRGVRLVGLSPEARQLWTNLPVRGPVALVLGEERHGLTEELRSLCDTTVRLPMAGLADSLNVGVAAGIMMYEFVRQELETKRAVIIPETEG